MNQMKSSTGDYYTVVSTIPIFCSNPHLTVPSHFSPIKKFAPHQQNETSDKYDVYGKLPQRSSTNIQCPYCQLHFSSQRQCSRHQRIHKVDEEHDNIPIDQGEEAEIVTIDGSFLVSREEVLIIIVFSLV